MYEPTLPPVCQKKAYRSSPDTEQACNVALFLTDPAGHLLYLNDHMRDICSLTYNGGATRRWTCFLPPDEEPKVYAEWASQAGGKRECILKLKSVRWQENGLDLYVITTPVLTSHNDLIGHVGRFEDNPPNPAPGNHRENREDYYRMLMEEASDGIHTYDFNGNFIEVNPKLCEMLGYTEQELLRMNVRDLIPAEDLKAAPLRLADLHAGKTVISERNLLRKDGSLIPVEISGRMLNTGILQGIVRDIRERKETQHALRQAREELERRVLERTEELAKANRALQEEIIERREAEDARRDLLQQLVTIQEEERRRIARELHDHMGQYLAALLLDIKSLDAKLPTDAHQHLQHLKELTESLGRELHNLAWELRPSVLDDLGLHKALSTYLEQWSLTSGIAADFQVVGIDNHRFETDVETTIYRVVQEALTNVLKHSKATRVSLILENRPDHLLAIIEDNGQGFDLDSVWLNSAERRWMGLRGMRERVLLVGGSWNIESSIGLGTTIFVRIPV
jgi:PAS domain S-box-containing protein